METETRKINRLLRDEARRLGLCDKWYRDWDGDTTRQELIEMYLKGIDFCIKHDFPRLEFIRAVFPRRQLLLNGIFVDESVDGSNVKTAVLIGQSSGRLCYSGRRSCDVYVRHDSSVSIEAAEGAKVFVEAYDNCKVTVSSDEASKVFVYLHGGEILPNGNVTVRDKRKAGV